MEKSDRCCSVGVLVETSRFCGYVVGAIAGPVVACVSSCCCIVVIAGEELQKVHLERVDMLVLHS